MSKWIKCSEQMPADGQTVLMCGPGESVRWVMNVGRYWRDVDHLSSHWVANGDFDPEQTTHWMPLPEVPNERE